MGLSALKLGKFLAGQDMLATLQVLQEVLWSLTQKVPRVIQEKSEPK